MSIHDFQIWLVTWLEQDSWVSELMQTAWTWPTVESLHFLGLCLLIGCIGTFDLRLLGVARRVPIAAVHRLVPFGILGFAINVTTGMMFVMTEPDQYIYNPSFHLKLMFLAIAGTNAAMFYLSSFRRIFGPGAALDAPRRARATAADFARARARRRRAGADEVGANRQPGASADRPAIAGHRLAQPHAEPLPG